MQITFNKKQTQPEISETEAIQNIVEKMNRSTGLSFFTASDNKIFIRSFANQHILNIVWLITTIGQCMNETGEYKTHNAHYVYFQHLYSGNQSFIVCSDNKAWGKLWNVIKDMDLNQVHIDIVT